MADPVELNVRLKDMEGNILYPETRAKLVKNKKGEALGDVEAGAQVNILEGVNINGQSGVLDEHKVLHFEIEALAEYSFEKLATPETGYAATYQLTKDGVGVGDKVNIPKDLVVESGSVKTCTEDDVPVIGYKVGDVYIDMILANADNQHIYILAADLVDSYTAGAGLLLNDHEFSVNTQDPRIVDTTPTEGSLKLVQSGGVATAISNLRSDVDEALAGVIKESEVDAKDQAVKDDIYKRIWSNSANPDKGYLYTKLTNAQGGHALIFNEEDGGGSQALDKTANVMSYVGTNLEEGNSANANAVDVQIYSIDNTTKEGTRLNANPNGMYYVKGAKGQGNPANREIAVKEDLDNITVDVKDEVLGEVAETYYDKAQANALFLSYERIPEEE